jgi:hypothetical protein
MPPVPGWHALAVTLMGGLANSLIESLLEQIHDVRMLPRHQREFFSLSSIGGDRGKLIDLPQQRLELGLALMFEQPPGETSRRQDEAILRNPRNHPETDAP